MIQNAEKLQEKRSFFQKLRDLFPGSARKRAWDSFSQMTAVKRYRILDNCIRPISRLYGPDFIVPKELTSTLWKLICAAKDDELACITQYFSELARGTQPRKAFLDIAVQIPECLAKMQVNDRVSVEISSRAIALFSLFTERATRRENEQFVTDGMATLLRSSAELLEGSSRASRFLEAQPILETLIRTGQSARYDLRDDPALWDSLRHSYRLAQSRTRDANFVEPNNWTLGGRQPGLGFLGYSGWITHSAPTQTQNAPLVFTRTLGVAQGKQVYLKKIAVDYSSIGKLTRREGLAINDALLPLANDYVNNPIEAELLIQELRTHIHRDETLCSLDAAKQYSIARITADFIVSQHEETERLINQLH